jgi:4a-hydroxytetrahydrobiopterin dehydratase
VSSEKDPKHKLSFEDVEEEGLADWRLLYRTLHARFRTGDFATGLTLVQRIGEAAERVDHHPDIVLTYPHVDVRLTSHDVDGVTSRDIALAREISGLAADLGVGAAPEETVAMELALDTPAFAEIKEFWAVVLGYDQPADRPDEVKAADGMRPSVWFQEAPSAGHEGPQRFHLDVMVPPEVAEERVRAAVAAGGTLVSDAEAPSFWVLADAHGNKACVCTGQDRQDPAA